jgi:hypothetical protein
MLHSNGKHTSLLCLCESDSVRFLLNGISNSLTIRLHSLFKSISPFTHGSVIFRSPVHVVSKAFTNGSDKFRGTVLEGSKLFTNGSDNFRCPVYEGSKLFANGSNKFRCPVYKGSKTFANVSDVFRRPLQSSLCLRCLGKKQDLQSKSDGLLSPFQYYYRCPQNAMNKN